SLGANSLISGEACLEAGMTRTYTLTNAPVNSSFRWSLPAGWSFASPDSIAQTVQVKTGTQGGVLSVVTRGTSCEGVTRTFAVQTKPARPAALNGENCLAANSTGNSYSIGEVAGATGYTWTLTGGLTSSSPLVNGSNSISVNVGTTGGTISVVANNGTCSGPPLTKTVSLLPAAPVFSASTTTGTIINPTCYNAGVSQQLTFSIANPPAGQTYEWQVVDAVTLQPTANWTIKSGTPTTAASVVFVTTGTSGSYNVQVRASVAGCGTSAWTSSPEFAPLSGVMITKAALEDAGGQYGEALTAVQPSGFRFPVGTTYQWYKGNTLLTGETKYYLYLQSADEVPNERYWVRVTRGTCTANSLETPSDFDPLSARMSSPEATQTDGVNVYPNPSNGEFTLTLPAFKGQAGVVLKNLQGQVVYRTEVSKTKSKFLAGRLSSGVYLLQVSLDGKVITKKVTVKK
ncbi:MAG: T9SS type A sorting domain-containing protein, partial [Cytophagales bacterium]|nr:T9SS type A sorting domain-containing protein [Cytophagales bacterium]